MPTTLGGERTREAFLDAASRFSPRRATSTRRSRTSVPAAASQGRSTITTDNKESCSRIWPGFYRRGARPREARPSGRPLRQHQGDRHRLLDTYKEYVPTLTASSSCRLKMPGSRRNGRSYACRGRDVMCRDPKAYRDGFARGIDEHAFASAIMSDADFFCWTWLANGGEPGSGRWTTTSQ